MKNSNQKKSFANNFVSVKTALSLFTLIVASAVTAFAAVPANDNFANAQQLTMPDTFSTISGDLSLASSEAGEPNHAGLPGGISVWYKITPAATTVMRMTAASIDLDPMLAVYTGATVGNLTVVAFNDNRYSLTKDSQIEAMLVAGQTYYIAVDGRGGIQGPGAQSFSLTYSKLNAPLNDNFANAYFISQDTTGNYSGTTFNASRETGEPLIFSGNPFGRSVWYKWIPSRTYSASFEITENFDSQIGIFTSAVANPAFNQLTRITSSKDSLGDAVNRYRVTFFAEAGKTYWIAVDWHDTVPNNTGIDAGNFQLKLAPNRFRYSSKLYEYQSRSAVSVFRPADGVWYSVHALGLGMAHETTQFGQNGDVPIPADFDGDGITDAAVTRNVGGQKIWYVLRSRDKSFHAVQWGLSSDKVVAGDFDGDGRGDTAVFRASLQGATWYIRHSSDNALQAVSWGTLGDVPTAGDFDGDGLTDIAVVRNDGTRLTWYVLKSSTSYAQFSAAQFGASGDKITAEDYDGDAKTDIAVFRPSNGFWYVLRSSDNQFQAAQFGFSGDRPQPADYNGDGRADFAVFRPSAGAWYIAKPAGVPAQNFETVYWGTSTDLPVTSLAALGQ